MPRIRTGPLNLIKILNFILTCCYTANVELNEGSWNKDKRLKHGRFSSDNVEYTKSS